MTTEVRRLGFRQRWLVLVDGRVIGTIHRNSMGFFPRSRGNGDAPRRTKAEALAHLIAMDRERYPQEAQ